MIRMDIQNVEQHIETEYHVSWFIIVYKMAFGLIEFFSGVGIAVFGRKMLATYTYFVTRELSEEPHDLLARLSEQIVPHIVTHNTYLVIYLILLGLAKIAGAVGLIYKKNWGVDLLVALTLIMFPFQCIHLIIRPSLIEFVYIIVGLSIAMYLINFHPKEWATRVSHTIRQQQIHHH